MFLTLTWILIILRIIQLIFSIILLGLSAGFISIINGNFGRVTYNLIISIFTIIYLAVLLFGQKIRIIQPITILIADSVFFIFWLAAFACVADTFGSVSCSENDFLFVYSVDFTACRISKAIIAFGVLNWVAFGASLVLTIIFILVPSYKTGGYKAWLEKRGYEVNGFHSEPKTDIEKPAPDNAESEVKINEDSSNNDLPEANLPEEAIQQHVISDENENNLPEENLPEEAIQQPVISDKHENNLPKGNLPEAN